MLNLMMLLKQILENVKPLRDTLKQTDSPFLQYIKKGLSNPIYEQLLTKLCNILEPEIQVQKSRTYFQRLFVVKAGVNDFLDMLRVKFSQNIDEVSSHVNEMAGKFNLPFKMIHTVTKGFYMRLHLDKNTRTAVFPEELEVTSRTNKFVCAMSAKLFELNDNISKIGNQMQIMNNMIICQLFQTVRNEIHVIYSLLDFITELDVILALAEFSKSHAQCTPSFGKELEIVDGEHPLLHIAWQTEAVIPNNVLANPEYNFFVISGNNMCGKTTYIKMIAVLQILAQMGCNVPAKSAKMRICDKIFSRIGFEDKIDENLSSFTAEMHDMEFIFWHMTPKSLIIIDELCR